MTPGEALDALIPRWRASLPAEYPAELVDGFVRRRRSDLEALLAEVIAVRRLRRGSLPETPADFSAVRLLAERERRHHAAADKDIARRLKKRTAKLSAAAKDQGADAEGAPRRMFGEYVLVRAEALLMGQMGWDAIPLLLRRPLLAIYSASSVVLVHRHGDDGPEDAIFPGLEASASDLRSDLETAHDAATSIVTEIGDRGPEPIWARARGRGAAEIRERAHVVCRRCGARLREPGPHYAIGTIECPADASECVDAAVDAEEMKRRDEEARRRLAEDPVPVFTPPDRGPERARRRSEQQHRREVRAREKEEAQRQREARREERAEKRAAELARQDKRGHRAKPQPDLDAEEWFEAGELPKSADEFAAYRRFADEHRPDEDQEDEALLAWTLKRQDALMGRRPDLDTEEAVTTAGFDFVRLRAEAIVLRALGHSAIPLMLKRPTLTVTVEDAVIIHRHFPPELALVHGGDVSTYDYFQDAPTSVDVLTPLRQVHAQIERLRLHIGWMNIDTIAVMFWQRARELASTVKTADPEREELDAFYALLAPEPVERFGRMIHETRWASRAAAIRQLERAGFKFIKGSRWHEGYWSRFPRTAVVKGATVQVTAAL